MLSEIFSDLGGCNTLARKPHLSVGFSRFLWDQRELSCHQNSPGVSGSVAPRGAGGEFNLKMASRLS